MTSRQTNKTSADYTPAVLLEPGKPPRRCNVRAVRLDSAEGARAKLAAGKAAWVAEGDVTAVTGAGNPVIQD